MAEEPPPPNPKKPFQATPQVLVIVLITLIAMALPLAGVALMVKGYLRAQRAPAPPPGPSLVDPKPLESALENVAEQQLGGDRVRLDGGEGASLTLTLPGDQIAARVARVEELAREAGGSALEMPTDAPPAKRLIIQVPTARRDLLRRGILGEKIDFTAIPDGTRTMILEVNFKQP